MNHRCAFYIFVCLFLNACLESKIPNTLDSSAGKKPLLPDAQRSQRVAQRGCDAGYQLEYDGTLCISKDGRAIGPFSKSLEAACKLGAQRSQYQEKDCENTEDWPAKLAKIIRGFDECMPGTELQTNGLCKGLDEDSKSAFGPFPKTLIVACFAGGGGPSCGTLRWDWEFSEKLVANSSSPSNATSSASGAAPDTPKPVKKESSAPVIGLQESDFARVAKDLGVEVAAVKAVAEVESGDYGGFAKNNKVIILYERHIFSDETKGKFDSSHPRVSSSVPGGYCSADYEPNPNFVCNNDHQWDRLNAAKLLNETAALKSASWGRFQVLGQNAESLGYTSVQNFVEMLSKTEGAHLDAFSAFVKVNDLTQALRSKDWAAFAAGYNGPGYRKFNYDLKMRDAYEKYKK